MNKNTSQGQILIPFTHFAFLIPDDMAGKITRELWCMNQLFSSVDIIIPPWFFMLMYHLGHEQYARWLPQFKDVVSPH
jgi:hypothetical protein